MSLIADLVASLLVPARPAKSDKRRVRRFAAGREVLCPVHVLGDAPYCVGPNDSCYVVAAPSGLLATTTSTDEYAIQRPVPAAMLADLQVRPISQTQQLWPRHWRVLEARDNGVRIRFLGSAGDVGIVRATIEAARLGPR